MSAELDQLTEEVRRLPGVLDVRLTTGPDGSFELAHLELVPGADRVATSLAALGVLRRHLRLPVPPESVRLQEVPPPAAEPRTRLPVQRGSRPVILRNELLVSGYESTSTVVLSCDERVAAGEAVGAATTTAVRRTTAQATLRAVQRLMGDRIRFDVQTVEVVGQGVEASVLVTLSLVGAHGVQRLTGAAVMGDDESRAVIRATLDGVNRRLESLLA